MAAAAAKPGTEIAMSRCGARHDPERGPGRVAGSPMVLAQCLRDIDAPAHAFAAFERARRRRVEAIVKQSRRTGNAKAVSGPIGEWIRDRVLPLFLRLGTQAQERHYAFRLNWEQRYG